MNIHKKSFISVAWEQRCIENDTLKNRYTYICLFLCFQSQCRMFFKMNYGFNHCLEPYYYNIGNTLLTYKTQMRLLITEFRISPSPIEVHSVVQLIIVRTLEW